MIKKSIIKKIEEQDNERYSKRLKKLGPVVRALGWDTKENQWKRFESAVSLINLEGKNIVDIGCGFGDFFEFLKERKVKIASYTGIDINEDLLAIAKTRHPNGIFKYSNILLEPPKREIADIGFAFGTLNFNLRRKPNNYEYAREFIKKALGLCKEALLVDMLSSYLDKSYPKEDFVFYYSPEKMLKFAQTLTPNVVLKHDYQPIPQKEFMLCLRKI